MNKRVKAVAFCALPELAAIAIFAGMKSCANDLPESSGPLPLGAEVIFVAPASGNQVVVCKEGPQTTVYSVEKGRYRLLESKSGYWIPDAQGKLVNIKIPQGARLRYVGLRSRYPASIETDPRLPKSERKFYDTVKNEWVSFPDPDFGDLTAVFERNGVMAGIKRRGSLAVWNGHKVEGSKLGPELKEAMFVAISGTGLELMTADLDEMRSLQSRRESVKKPKTIGKQSSVLGIQRRKK